MEAKSLFSSTIPLLERNLDLRSVKHNLTVSNIANMDTPNYKAFDMIVEEELQKYETSGSGGELQKTHSAHLSQGGGPEEPIRYIPYPQSGFTSGMKGNTVDMDKVMASLTENGLKYNASAQILSKKLQGLKLAIQGGGK